MDPSITARGPAQLSWGPTTLAASQSLIRCVGGPWMPWVPGHGSRKWSLVLTLLTHHYTEREAEGILGEAQRVSALNPRNLPNPE